MNKTTIYLDDKIKQSLLIISLEESKEKGKRVAMSETIRAAIEEYLEKRGMSAKDPDSLRNRMLSTKGKLGTVFEKNVKELKEEFKKWKM